MNEHVKRSDTPKDAPSVNKYYESVAVAFRYAKFVTLFAAVLFLMFFFSFFREEVSIENFQYMLKYITSEDSSLITTQKIHYPTSDSKALELFAGDFVSAGSGGISLYDTHGNTVLEIRDSFSSPVFALGKKYGLCYDLSGSTYVIFNTFAKLKSEELDRPIADAVMTDSGSYAILTKSREYRTVINVYNNDYELVSRVYKDKYTFDMDMSSKKLLYVTAEARDSSYLTELNVLPLKSDTESTVASIYDEFPLCSRFTSSGIVLITDRSIRFYSTDDEETAKYSFASQTPSGAKVNNDIVMLYFVKNTIGSENDIKFYSSSGEYMFSAKLAGKIGSIDLVDGIALVQTDKVLYRIDTETRKMAQAQIEAGADKALLQADMTALVCYKNYARLIDFKDTDEEYILS